MQRFEKMTTPLVADAVIRLGLPAKIAPSGIRPLVAGSKFAGPASPVVLNGYADRVLECIYRSDQGNVLVLDNKDRSDEANVERGDFVFADDDGVLFVPKEH